MTILGIETSCDETAISVCKNGEILSNIVGSQLIHSEFGGVVPEVASREHERLLYDLTIGKNPNISIAKLFNIEESLLISFLVSLTSPLIQELIVLTPSKR